MPKRKSPETEAELLAAFADLFDEIDMESDDDTDEVLRAAGYDLDELNRKARAIVDEAITSSPLNWRNKKVEIAREKERFNRIHKPEALSRAETEASIKKLIAVLPEAKRPAMHARNFEDMSDDDLNSWYVELKYLSEGGNQGKDSDIS